MTPEEGGTWIPSGKIYEELRGIKEEVIKLRTELAQVARIDARLTLVERRVWWLSGVSAAVGTAAGYVLQ